MVTLVLRRLFTGCPAGVCGWIVGAAGPGGLERAIGYGRAVAVLAFGPGAWLAAARQPPAADPQG